MLPPSWPLLLYAIGGLAVANLNVSNSFNDTTTSVGEGESNDSNNQTGWALGGGVEPPLIQHLTINAEDLYLDLGNASTTSSVQNSAGGFGPVPNSLQSSLTTSANLHANLLKIGLNYKF